MKLNKNSNLNHVHLTPLSISQCSGVGAAVDAVLTKTNQEKLPAPPGPVQGTYSPTTNISSTV